MIRIALRLPLASLAALWIGSAVAAAMPGSFQVVSHSRTISVESSACGGDNQSDDNVAPGLAYWEEAVDVASTCPTTDADCTAEQRTEITDNGANGSLFCFGAINAQQAGSAGTILAESRLELLFDLTAASTYSLDASLISYGGGTTHAKIELTDTGLPPGSNLIHSAMTVIPEELTIGEVGNLPAGQYLLIVSAVVEHDAVCCSWDIDFGSCDFSILFSDDVGTAYCTGVSCPCGNDYAGGGCLNSTGAGATILATGSASIADDDLNLTTLALPSPGATGLYFMGSGNFASPVQPMGTAGYVCVNPSLRFPVVLDDGIPPNHLVLAQVVSAAAAGGMAIQPGETWNFQSWFRDINGSPCGSGANLSNALAVTFTP